MQDAIDRVDRGDAVFAHGRYDGVDLPCSGREEEALAVAGVAVVSVARRVVDGRLLGEAHRRLEEGLVAVEEEVKELHGGGSGSQHQVLDLDVVDQSDEIAQHVGLEVGVLELSQSVSTLVLDRHHAADAAVAAQEVLRESRVDEVVVGDAVVVLARAVLDALAHALDRVGQSFELLLEFLAGRRARVHLVFDEVLGLVDAGTNVADGNAVEVEHEPVDLEQRLGEALARQKKLL